MIKHALPALLATLLLGTTLAAAAQPPRGLAVAEVVIARSVEDHEPVGAGTTFSRTGGPLVCFIRASNRGSEEAAVFVAWEAASNPVARARGGTRLAVPPRQRYRTYARTVIERDAGRYRCVVRDEHGGVLGSAEFELTE